MSIEIIEETKTVETAKTANNFLPPVVTEVRRSSRNALGFVTTLLFVLGAVAVCLMSLAIGLPVLVLGCMMLFTDIIGFVRSKRLDGRFALNLRQKCYWFCGVILLMLAILSNFSDIYGEYTRLFASVQINFYDLLPFGDLFVGGINECILLASIGLGTLSMGCVYWSLNHSKHRNYPYCSVAMVSFLINIVIFVLLNFGGLSVLGIVPENPVFEMFGTAYFAAGIYFAFGIVALLWAIRSIIIFTRMRKVKNAVFKA